MVKKTDYKAYVLDKKPLAVAMWFFDGSHERWGKFDFYIIGDFLADNPVKYVYLSRTTRREKTAWKSAYLRLKKTEEVANGK
jgi:hypothetical protein